MTGNEGPHGPTSSWHWKKRLIRADDVADNLLLVIRATPPTREEAIEAITRDALRSGRAYVVEVPTGDREVLFGVSVFAHRPGIGVGDVLLRFPAAPAYVEAPVRVIRAAGFAVLATGTNRDHFDVQLVSGVREGDQESANAEVRIAAARLLDVAGELQLNPLYAGHGDDPRWEDR